MSNKRPIILMGLLLGLLLLVIGRPYLEPLLHADPMPPAEEPPLPGQNAISRLDVQMEAEGRWVASIDYFYTGEPRPAFLSIDLQDKNDPASSPEAGPIARYHGFTKAERGAHSVKIEIHPRIREVPTATRQVTARLHTNTQILTSRQVAQTIDWPDWQTWEINKELAGKTPEQILASAVARIDRGDGDSLRRAKSMLERLLRRDPQVDGAYIELARVAMKSNWSPEGLYQAEKLLASALQINPTSTNANILLGYVYAHQGRHKEAEALFIEAARKETPNLWLWTNWGEVLAMQGKNEAAIEKYRQAIAQPRSSSTYDRARVDAYWRAIRLLEQSKNLDGAEALYKQRFEEYGPADCSGANYAMFMLQQRNDTAAAMTIAQKVLDAHCTVRYTREVLGLSYYMMWANGPEAQRETSINQARVYLPPGPRLLYLLAKSEHTAKAIAKLKAAGESLDQLDNEKLTALSYALEDDLAAAKRLLRAGARTDTLVSPASVPVALLPVMNGNIPAVRLMQQSGVDYSSLRFQGITAIEHAKRMGDRKLMDALDPKARSL